MISVECFKMEELSHADGSTTMDRVKTAGWGMQIKSSKDIIQFVEDDTRDDEYGDAMAYFRCSIYH
jgi:hypothetical protein